MPSERRLAQLIEVQAALSRALAKADGGKPRVAPLPAGYTALGSPREELRDPPEAARLAFARALLFWSYLNRQPSPASVLRFVTRARAYVVWRAAVRRHEAKTHLPLSVTWTRTHGQSVPAFALRAPLPAGAKPPAHAPKHARTHTRAAGDTPDNLQPPQPFTAADMTAVWDALLADPAEFAATWAAIRSTQQQNQAPMPDEVDQATADAFFAEMQADPALFLLRYAGDTPEETIHALAQYFGVSDAQLLGQQLLDAADQTAAATQDALDFWATAGAPGDLSPDEWAAYSQPPAPTAAASDPNAPTLTPPPSTGILTSLPAELSADAALLAFESRLSASLTAAGAIFSDTQLLQLINTYWAGQTLQLGANGLMSDLGANIGIISSWNIVNPAALNYLREQSGALITNIDATTRAAVAETLWEGYRGIDFQALPIDRLATYLQQSMNALGNDLSGMSRARAVMIARTETARALSFGELAVGAKWGIRFKRWVANAGACLICLGNVDAGVIPLDAAFPGAYIAPPQHPMCFPGDTLVTTPGVVGSTERWYAGPLVELRTATGYVLTCTPNHPILTPQGWVAAGLLHEGSDVVCGTLCQGLDAPVLGVALGPDEHQIPARIEDVARAVGVASGMPPSIVKTAAEDFHHDGLDGEVCVVRADGALVGDIQSASTQPEREQVLAGRDAILSPLIGASNLEFALQGDWLTTRSGMSRFDMGAPLLRSVVRGSDEVGCAVTAALYACAAQAHRDSRPRDAVGRRQRILGLTSEVTVSQIVQWNAHLGDALVCATSDEQRVPAITQQPALFEDGDEAFATDVKALCDDIGVVASDVGADRVLSAKFYPFAGHVYNLQTTTGWYLVHNSSIPQASNGRGIVAHNCRCAVQPVLANGDDAFDPANWAEPTDTTAYDGMLFNSEYGNFPNVQWPFSSAQADTAPPPTPADLGMLDYGSLSPDVQSILTPDLLDQMSANLATRAQDGVSAWADAQGIATPETDALLGRFDLSTVDPATLDALWAQFAQLASADVEQMG